jgi:DNA-binding transcriptional LysR family regulator
MNRHGRPDSSSSTRCRRCLAANGVPLTPDDLKAHACLHHQFPTSRKLERWPLRPEHAVIETELPRTAVASTIEPLICMAEQGVGIACLPDFAIGRQLREGVLVAVLDDYTDCLGTLRVLWPSSRHLAPKLRVFVDFLAANLFPLSNVTQTEQETASRGVSVRHASPSGAA